MGKGGGSHNLLVREVAVDITCTLEISLRRTPTGRVWVASRNVGRDASAREEPDTDVVARPLRRVNTAPSSVEATTVCGRILRRNLTSRVRGLAGGIDIAVGCGHGAAGVTTTRDGAP